MFGKWPEVNPRLAQTLPKDDRAPGSDALESLKNLNTDKISTHAAGGNFLQEIAILTESIIVSSADLVTSTGNYIKDGGNFSADISNRRNADFAIRKHAMTAIMKGVSYEGVFRPVRSTFLVFSDYRRAAMRMAALANLGTIFVSTHDSIAAG
jgi:transketolase